MTTWKSFRIHYTDYILIKNVLMNEFDNRTSLSFRASFFFFFFFHFLEERGDIPPEILLFWLVYDNRVKLTGYSLHVI